MATSRFGLEPLGAVRFLQSLGYKVVLQDQWRLPDGAGMAARALIRLAHLDEEVRRLTASLPVAKRLGIDRRTVGRTLRKQGKR